jgi:twinkle protein|tara:strand:+ start:265 stop:1956 length:1692 start_codon:yes stop_codon:yes gene_type:complete
MAFVLTHQPCTECNSSDALSVNEDGSAFCFSHGAWLKDTNNPHKNGSSQMQEVPNLNRNKPREPVSFADEGQYAALRDRQISLETAKKFGVKVTFDQAGDIKKHIYPYYDSNEVVANKTRFVDNKSFFWSGENKKAPLFGQNLFKEGGKYITITEGECDAMAAYELLGSKWPVVSIKSGAQSAERDVKDNLEYIESFENVIIAFDADTHGREAARKVARILKPSKSKILTLPEGFKDPNDMLKGNQHAQFVRCFWDAKTYTPSGVMNVSENRDKYKNREKKPSIPFPWQGLNDKLEGMHQGELITITGGTGLGKSSVTRELEHWLIKQTGDNVGVIALEEDWRRTIDGILSIEANAKLHIDRIREQFTDQELDDFFDVLYDGENRNRVWVHAHHGANDIDAIFSKLRFMIVGCDCKWVVVDHLHMLVSTSADGDERRTIDAIMHRLRTLVAETGVCLILVSHLRRIDGNKGHENGIETGLNHLRGSQSIAQLSDCVLSLERNQQSTDAVEASTTKVRILKSRYTGDVGLATHLLYDNDTGRLAEIATDDITNNSEEDIVLGFE